jgi:hypothetical protein
MPPMMITQPMWCRNEDAARLFINSQMIILGTYLIEMLLVGIGGILIAFYTNSISPRQPRLILREDWFHCWKSLSRSDSGSNIWGSNCRPPVPSATISTR